MNDAVRDAWKLATAGTEINSLKEVMKVAESLQTVLQANSPFREILEAKHVYPHAWFIPEPFNFSIHVVTRAQAVGVESVIMEFEKYLNETQIEFQQVVPLARTFAETEYTFVNGVSFLGCQNLIPSSLKSRILNEHKGHWGQIISGVLARKFTLDKVMMDPSEDPPLVGCIFQPDDDFAWTRLAMTLVSGGATPEIYREVAVPDHYGFLQEAFGRDMILDLNLKATILSNKNFNETDTVLAQIANFKSEEKPRLLILLEYFYRARLESNPVRKAINLRICLENMVIFEGEKEQLVSKVKDRGKPLFGRSKTELADIYDTLSSAVHRGEIPSGAKFRPSYIEDILQVGIKKILTDGSYPIT